MKARYIIRRGQLLSGNKTAPNRTDDGERIVPMRGEELSMGWGYQVDRRSDGALMGHLAGGEFGWWFRLDEEGPWVYGGVHRATAANELVRRKEARILQAAQRKALHTSLDMAADTVNRSACEGGE